MNFLKPTFNRVRAKLRLPNKLDLLASKFPDYRIGYGSYGDLKIIDYGEGSVFSMGSYCSVAAGCKVLLGGEHRADWVTTYPFSVTEPSLSGIEGHPRSKGSVTIGSDVWLATDVTILSGVTIGHGAVIAAGSIVTRDIDPYTIVSGVPAKPVRTRFDQETIDRLLAIKWWDWPHHRIVAAGPYLMCDSISHFLDAAEADVI